MYLISSSSGYGHDDDVDMKQNPVYEVSGQRVAIDLQQNPVYGFQGVQTQSTGKEMYYVKEGMGPEQPHEYDYVAALH